MIELVLMDSTVEGECNNVGAACFGCPMFDSCTPLDPED